MSTQSTLEADVNIAEALANPELLAFLEQYGTKFRVTALPADVREHREARLFYLYVERRSAGKWAVTDGSHEVLSRTGKWRWESQPSSRTDKFIEVTRFSLVDAFKLAEREAPKMQINRFGVAEITEHIRQWQLEDAAREAEHEAAHTARKAEKAAKKAAAASQATEA